MGVPSCYTKDSGSDLLKRLTLDQHDTVDRCLF